MVRATGAQFGQTTSVLAVYETQDRGVILNGADKAFLLAHLPAQPRQQLGKHLAAHLLRQRGVFLAAKGFLVAALLPVGLFNMRRGLLDEIK